MNDMSTEEKLKENGNKIALNCLRQIIKANLSSPKPISLRALTYLSDHLTTVCAELAKDAEKLLAEQNNLRELQGLSEKVRLTEDLFQEVLERRNGKNN